MVLARAPEIELVGVSTVVGNTSLEARPTTALLICARR
nr:nucleoside hydrolase [Nocardia kruczakiae]